jgi:septum formation protein
MKINHLVLASTSRYRQALLNQVGISHRAIAPHCDEESITADDPSQLARARSEAKGLSLPYDGETFVAISADQVLDFEGHSYGKAESREEAEERLKLFAGNRHVLRSAYSLLLYTKSGASLLKSRVESATMTMRPLTNAEIDAYLDTKEWEGCAGCYQYENLGMNLFSAIEGDMSTIIGLPLPALLEDLRDLGINVLLKPEGPWELDEIIS